MNKTTISSILLGLLLMAAGTSQALAWNTHFHGTRDQVRNACVGPGRVLEEVGDSSICKNTNNGTAVDCNDAGNCVGGGSGPAPRVNVSMANLVVGVLGAAARKGELDPRMIFGDPHSGQSGAGTATGGTGWDAGDFGEWHANPKGTGGAMGGPLGGGIFAN